MNNVWNIIVICLSYLLYKFHQMKVLWIVHARKSCGQKSFTRKKMEVYSTFVPGEGPIHPSLLTFSSNFSSYTLSIQSGNIQVDRYSQLNEAVKFCQALNRTHCIRYSTKDPFDQSDSTMWYQTHVNLNTPCTRLLDPPPDFVLRGPNPLLKVIKLPCVWYHKVSCKRTLTYNTVSICCRNL